MRIMMEYHADVAVIIALCASSRKKICLKMEREIKMTDTIDKKELILKIIPLKKNIEECAEEVDGPHWWAYKSSYYRGYLDAISDIVNKIYE